MNKKVRKDYEFPVGIVFTFFGGLILAYLWVYRDIAWNGTESIAFSVGLLILAIIFTAGGVHSLITSFVYYRADKTTSARGERCYARIEDIIETEHESGSIVNGPRVTSYRYSIAYKYYLKSMDVVVPVKEMISRQEYYAYRQAEYISIKYYHNHVDIEEAIGNVSKIPVDIRRRLGDERV